MDDDEKRTSVAFEAGKEFSHYRVLSRIGAGGMGEVYLVQDTALNRKVALKFLSPALCSDSDCRARFTREAQAAAKLNNPNIVTIYEVSDYQGRPFFAMEYVEGCTLRDTLSQGEMTLEQFVRISMQVCEGLKAAHQMGVIHRDIKPSNILIDSAGRARIADFGLAVVRGTCGVTRSGSTAGTTAYMSPEQIRGEKVDAASDLFSLGIVMYQMLTGSLPFTGEYEAAIIYSITNDDPPSPGELRPDLPMAVEEMVLKLLEKDGNHRIQTADEVLGMLGKLTHGHDDHTKQPKRVPPIRIGILALILITMITVLQVIFDPLHLKAPQRKMLAVLPFENLGPAEDEYFADGMTDAITLHLAKFGELGVISRASSMMYKGSQKSPQEIGTDLGTSYLLTGTILWEKTDTSSEVRINTALVKAADGSHLWADSYERVLDKVFVLQSDIARNVTRALNVAVREADRHALERVPTANLQAYDYFLRGNEYFNRSWEREDIQIATELYRAATQLDSTFAMAWGMLSRGHASMYWEYYDRSEERRQQAIGAANMALDLQPDLVEGHLALGYCYYHCGRDYERALSEFDLALQQQPNNADLHNAIAAVQRRQGDFQNSVENFMTALELDPRSHLKAFDVGLTYGMMRQYRKSEKYLIQAISLAPDWPLPYIYRAWQFVIDRGDIDKAQSVLSDAAGRADLSRSKFYWWLRRVIETDYQKILAEINPGPDTAAYYLQCAQLNRLMGRGSVSRLYADSARIVLTQRLLDQPEDAGFHSSLGLAYAYLGMQQPAMANAQKAVDLLPTSKEAFDAPFLILNLAEILVMFEQYEAATEQLRFLLTIPGFISPAYLKLDPLWKPLRGHPDFKSLLVQSS
jgi:serine/threonine protein kinase/tetratricopeptide (TPR) repeat protein